MSETSETTRKCTNCSRGPQPLSEFASAKDPSVLVKRCAKCRSKDGKQKKRDDVRDKRNARGREQKYYEKYREKKRGENEDEFLKHNADVMKAWRDKHPGYQSALSKHVLSVRVSTLKSSSKVRRIKVDLTDDEISAIMLRDCTYCGKPSETGDFNGVDRMDSSEGYTSTNVVGCCQMCNYMKGSLDPVTFIGRCKHIAGVYEDASLWSWSGGSTFERYMHRSEEKNKVFEIEREHFETLRSGACRYCQREPVGDERFGVDRLDSSVGYVHDNCVTACSECNYMKRAFGETEFLEKCAAVANHAGAVDFEYDGPACVHSITKRDKTEV